MSHLVLLGALIKDVAMGPFGSNLKVDNFIESGVPVIKGGNLYGSEVAGNFSYVSEDKAQSLKRSLAYPDDIVITHRGTLGQVSIVPASEYPYYLVSQSQLRVTPDKNKVIPRYLLYYLRSAVGQNELMKHSSQVGVPSLATPTKAIKSLEIALPEMTDQQGIVEVLSSLDGKIELNRRMNETLEQIGQAVFTNYSATEIESNNWRIVKLKDLSNYIGRGISPLYDENGQFLILNQRCIRNKKLDLSSARRQSKSIGENKLLIKGDVLINSTGVGTLGRVAQVDWTPSNTTFDTHTMLVRPKPSVNSYYFGEMIRSLQPIFETMGSGTTGQTELSRIAVGELDVSVPEQQHMEKLGRLIEPYRVLMYKNEQAINVLAAIRDSLLPRLMAGLIKV